MSPDNLLHDTPPGPLVSCDWLARRLGEPDLKVVDASWYLPAMQRDGAAEFRAGHIPHAVHFDIDDICNSASDLPHTLPAPDDFARKVGALGISHRDRIVVYDGQGLFSAPRVWWMFRIYGAHHVTVLDGGLPAWKAGNHPLESGTPRPASCIFEARFDRTAVAAMADVAAALESGAAQVADARAAARFAGSAPEPRPGLPSGHMPGARSLPFTELVADGRLVDAAAIRAALAAAGIDPARPLITSCGSGVSAAIINLALAAAGLPAARLYDGSWTEWASRGMPIEPPPGR